MKIMITTTTKDTHKRLSTNSENGSFQNRPHLITINILTVFQMQLLGLLKGNKDILNL